ncbi:MAG: S8 family peptidase [Salinivirgaceae bacterium]|nr:S8 family peptidase [Salinivirgaceae bacterium]
MMKRIIAITILGLLYFSAFSQHKIHLANTIIVRFNTNNYAKGAEKIKSIENIAFKSITPLLSNFNYKKKDIPSKYDLSSIYKMELKNEKNIQQILSQLNNLAEIAYAELYYLPKVFEEPNDEYVGSQYYLPLIKAFEAHEICTGDTNIVIGIVDTGTDFYHLDLQANFKYNYDDPINGIDDDYDGFIDNFRGWDLANNDNNPQFLTSSHGVRVCGLASAVTNNEIGIASIGYNTKILPIKIAKDILINGAVVLSGSYEGIVYAADHDCDIINCSWGSTFKSHLCDDIIDYATNYKNCLVIASAGNDKNDVPFYPASCDWVLNVAATNQYDYKWDKSTYGKEVDVCAPGEGIYSTNNNNSYSSGNGTSYSAPITAGLAGLLKSYRPELSGIQLGEQIRVTTDVIDTLSENVFYYRKLGSGRINALKALTTYNMPSIRISNLDYSANQNIALIAGDTLRVSFSATNYLAQVTNTLIRLTTTSEHVTPLNNVIGTGQMDAFESINNVNNPFVFKIDNDIPSDHNVEFTFEMQDAGYNDFQIFEKIINRSYVDVSNGTISTTLSSNGKIGYYNRNEKIGTGFIYENGANLLNEAGIILGTDSENILSTILDHMDFATESIIDTSFSNETLQGKTTYAPEADLWSHNILVTQISELISTEPLNDFILHKYIVKNTGIEAIESLRLSIFTDWDLNGYSNNQAAFNSEQNLFYTYSNSTNVLYAGILYLGSGSAIPYGFDYIEGGNGGIDITSSFSNPIKWFTMTNSRPFAGNDGDSIDVVTMLTSPEFIIPENDSVEIPFALVIGDNYDDLLKNSQRVIDYYNHISISDQLNNEGVSIYPNPANTRLFIDFNNEPLSNCSIKIYNHLGQLQKTANASNLKVLEINLADLNQGIYYITVESEKDRWIKKLIISE